MFKPKFNYTKKIYLTNRQQEIIEFLNINGKVTNKDIRNMFEISSQSAHKEILKLVKLGIVKSEGKGRSLHYVLA